MVLNHGINTSKAETNFTSVAQGTSGVPFFIGCWPVHLAGGYKAYPQIAYTFDEAEAIGGYSDNWTKWGLCEAMYSQFKVFGRGPAVFMNLFNPAVNKKAITASAKTVSSKHQVNLGADALTSGLSVKNGTSDLTEGTDYTAFYDGGELIIELLEDGTAYDAVSLTIGYDEIDLTGIDATTVAGAVEKIEECKARFGVVPDLIVAPGWSKTPEVAAVMAAKSQSINGQFKAKVVVDLDTSVSGADAYDDVLAYKNANGYTDENMIVCWPLAKVGTKIFNMSTLIAGKLAEVDIANGDVPYESPSNKPLPITGCCNAAGDDILLSLPQADVVSVTAGVVTAINYDGWIVWGNYMGCYPGSADVAKIYIPTARMMDFICNTFVRSFWSYVDKPLTRVLIDAIVNSFNVWLAGLTHEGKLYGGEIAYVEDNNPVTDLIAGKFQLDAVVASPVPAQRIDMVVEFDVDILEAAING